MTTTPDTATIAVIGMGYVGRPLAVAFGRLGSVIGFDINEQRITELKHGEDHTLEVTPEDLAAADGLCFTDNREALKDATVYIITVPTPVDEYQRPDLTPLLGASRLVGSVLKRGGVVIFESTVYPGCTEKECVPALEAGSRLAFNKDFYCGYSPEGRRS